MTDARSAAEAPDGDGSGHNAVGGDELWGDERRSESASASVGVVAVSPCAHAVVAVSNIRSSIIAILETNLEIGRFCLFFFIFSLFFYPCFLAAPSCVIDDVVRRLATVLNNFAYCVQRYIFFSGFRVFPWFLMRFCTEKAGFIINQLFGCPL